MLSKIEIHNFKIHKSSELPLSPLTIFSGINGVGKSSVTQCLLMLRENVTGNCYPGPLNIKGKSFDIGDNFASLVNWYAEDSDRLGISLQTKSNTYSFDYQYTPESTTELSPYPGSKSYHLDELRHLPLFNDNFQYLSAFRYGPQESYTGDASAIKRRQVSISKGNGEYAVAILDKYGNDEIKVLDMAEGSDVRLATQTAYWLSRISPNVRVAVDGNFSTKYHLNFTYPSARGRYKVSPLNTGYGISYVLSIIVALLISPKDALVVIENPEAHIHPAAQSALMELVARAVKGGIQVIIESHSDHIIFGALVNMKKGLLNHDDVELLHFDIDEKGQLTSTSVTIGPDCRIKNAPNRFVEQMNLDLDILFDE